MGARAIDTLLGIGVYVSVSLILVTTGDIEIVDALTPRYDVERLGILKESSPRHADVLLCTGPVTRQSRDRLRRIYEQMPAPKWVVAVGGCSCSGGVFRDGYNVLGGIDQVLPVDIYIPGCPVRPEALIDGFLKLKEKIKAERIGKIETLKGREVPAFGGSMVAEEKEVDMMKKGWGGVVKKPEKATSKGESGAAKQAQKATSKAGGGT